MDSDDNEDDMDIDANPPATSKRGGTRGRRGSGSTSSRGSRGTRGVSNRGTRGGRKGRGGGAEKKSLLTDCELLKFFINICC